MNAEAVVHPGTFDAPPAPAPRRPGPRVALVLVALVAFAAWPIVDDLAKRPIRSVLVAGEFRHLSRGALEQAVSAEVGGAGFLAVDVDAVRAAALALPWVREATVRRVWPDRLQIAVVEREAVARWNEGSLLEEDGARFEPASLDGVGPLPVLEGPEGRHGEVLDRLRELEQAIAGSALGPIAALELDARGGWRVRLADDALVVLGHGQGGRSLGAFAGAAGALLATHPQGFERADLRYANGFAVRWREESRGESVPAGAPPESRTGG